MRASSTLPTGRADIVIPLLDRQAITRFAGSDDTHGERFSGGVVQGAQDRDELSGLGNPQARRLRLEAYLMARLHTSHAVAVADRQR